MHTDNAVTATHRERKRGRPAEVEAPGPRHRTGAAETATYAATGRGSL